MKTALICEHAWQAERFEEDSGLSDALIFAASSEAAYELTMRGLDFIEPRSFSMNEKIWSEYPEHTNRMFSLSKRFDELLHKVEPSFARQGLSVFHYFNYLFKIGYDQLAFIVDSIRALHFEKQVTHFVCVGSGTLDVDETGLFTDASSLYQLVLQDMAEVLDITVSVQEEAPGGKEPSNPFSFGQPRELIKRFAAGTVGRSLYNLLLRCKATLVKDVIISVGCKEVDTLAAQEGNLSVIKINHSVALSNDRRWSRQSAFLQQVSQDDTVNKLLEYGGVKLLPYFTALLTLVSSNLSCLYSEYVSTKKLLKAVKPKVVVFQTMAPFYLANIVVREACQQLSIPYTCWMHGGYGVTKSLAGYDVSDFRDCNTHIVYGEVLNELFKDETVLDRIGIQPPQKIAPLGSPYFNQMYEKVVKPRNAKKRVVFCLGIHYGRNKFYFGYNRSGAELDIWDENIAIIKVLAKYQDVYDIVVKDYPGSPRAAYFPRLLESLGASKISFISAEEGFDACVSKADALIFPWISTTFFQSLYLNAELLVLEGGDIKRSIASTLSEHIVFSENVGEFCDKVDDYLRKGYFETQNLAELRKMFLSADRNVTLKDVLDVVN